MIGGTKQKMLMYYFIATCVSVVVPFISSILIHFIQRENESISLPVLILIFYLCQLGIGIGILKVMTDPMDFRLSQILTDWRHQLKWVLVYLSIWFAIITIFYTLSHFLNSDFYNYASSWWLLDQKAFINEMLTTCLQAGFFEEIFFRGVVAFLILYGTGLSYDEMKPSMRVCIVCYSGLLFSLAHVYYDVFPFRILPLDYTQLLTTFIVGCIMTHFYFITRNIIGPILAHTGGNIIQVLIGYGYVFMMKP